MPRQRRPRIFINPPRLTWNFIRKKAEEFRRNYVSPIDSVPVPIIEIAELKLGIQPIPKAGLKSRIDIDGFLTNDLKNICVDLDVYMDERQINRVRFTFAHEVGHLILHENEIRQCDFRTEEDWIHFHEDFLKDDLNWFEQHANEFAGRLLVPKEELIREIQNHQNKIDEYRSIIGDGEEMLIEAISRLICDKFKVSWIVIQKRIRIENIRL
ncbi:MAG: ImmA/IrrE family metallo-endopeptidase [Candidatus Aminicenantes bacterium]|nr:ImmA/IrrE family metallo-endopeptidase [Candidatus Aminicenantes bacterium]